MSTNIIFAIIKIVFSIGLLALAFWPNGLGMHLLGNFENAPIRNTIIVAFWGILLALNLPLSRIQFTKLSTLCLLVIFAAITLYLYQIGQFDFTNSSQWIILGIVFGGTLLGWWPNASKIWRWYRGVYGVDDADTGGE